MNLSLLPRFPSHDRRINRLPLLIVLICFLSLAVACTAQQPAAQTVPLAGKPDSAATETAIARNIFATLTAAPTATPPPSATVVPPAAQVTPTLAPTTAPTTPPSAVSTPAPTSQPPGKATVPATATPSGPVAVVQSAALNVRAGPGTAYPVVGSARQGESLAVTGRTQDSAWLEVNLPSGKKGWVSSSLVRSSVSVQSVAVAAVIPTPPPPPPTTVAAPAPVSGPAPSQGSARWTLVADSAADFPGGRDHNNWYYLWTDGRNNFRWQDMAYSDANSCYKDAGGKGMELCRDTIKADPSGDVGLQWKASQSGTYRFEWDSPWLKFYKHAQFVSTEGKGSQFQFSATIQNVIEWEMFFWVAGDSTPCHVRVYRLEPGSGLVAGGAAPPPAGGSELGVRKEAGGIALTVLNMQKTYQVDEWIDAAPGDIALVIEVEIETTGRESAPYNPLYFDVQDSAGNVWRSSVFAPKPDLPSGTLARGEKVRGMVAFVVPHTASGFTVIYEPIVILGGYVPIRVRLGA